ncbi:MAG: hypothetical protein HY926_10830, partial [Elusimicrobia bacterium]|nr:hypothetical protein [Elusimicrobiota bacterium]
MLVAADAETSAWSGAARRWVLYDGRSLPGPLKLQSGAAALALPGPEPEAAAGALAALAGLDLETLDAALERRLRAEPSESAAARIQAARRAFASAAQQAGSARLSLASSGRRLPLLCGPEALGLGALAAGCTCFFAPEPGRGRGAAAWLLGLAARGGLSSCPASDENAALGAAAGAAAAGARALADLTAGSLAAAAEMLRCCAESGLPVVVL